MNEAANFPQTPVQYLEIAGGHREAGPVTNNLVLDKFQFARSFPMLFPGAAEAASNTFCTISTGPTDTTTDSGFSNSRNTSVGIRSEL
jgi:hypothetical protein